MSGGVGPRKLHVQKNLKHPKLNEGQRPVGLDQDSCISKKIEAYSDESKPQRGATSGRVWTKRVGILKELRL